MGWIAVLGSCRCRRHIRFVGRISDRPLRPQAGTRLEHSAIRVFGLASGFVTSLPALLLFRCTTFIGVCVEFVAAVAWLAELFPDPKRREAVLGYTQAFSSIGGLLVTGAYLSRSPLCRGATRHPWWTCAMAIHVDLGGDPALPLIIIRPFLPESPAWARKRRRAR